MSRTLTTAECAEEVGLTTRTLTNYLRRGAPCDRDSAGHRWDADELRAWMRLQGYEGRRGRRGRDEALAAPPKDQEVPEEVLEAAQSLDQAMGVKAKLQRAELAKRIILVKKHELDYRVRSAEYHSREECREERMRRILAVKAGLLALPHRVAPRITSQMGQRQIRHEIGAEVLKLLRQFAGDLYDDAMSEEDVG